MLQILITPLVAALISQLFKPLVKTNSLNWDWHAFVSYSGMPSSHTAMAVSLASSVGLIQGFNSPLFFVCVAFGLFIIRDAVGLRHFVGQHGQALNYLIKDLSGNKIIDAEKYPRLFEKIGHTPAQILVGALLGFLISLAGFYIF